MVKDIALLAIVLFANCITARIALLFVGSASQNNLKTCKGESKLELPKPQNPNKLLRGFATLSPEKRQEIASKGGKAVQAAGTAHRWNSETGKAAAKKSRSLKNLSLFQTEIEKELNHE
jgi:uncharacterized protein